MEPAAAQTVMGNFALSAQLPNGRTISVSAYLVEGETAESLNRRLDAYQEAIERQRIRCEIPELEAKREAEIKALEQYREHLAGLDEKRKTGSKTLSSQERMTLQNAQVNINRATENIKRGEEAIAEAKKKAGVG